MDEKKLKSELDEFILKDIQNKEEVITFLENLSKRHKTLQIGNIKIKVRPTIPRKQRALLFKIRNMYQKENLTEDEITEVDNALYSFLSEVCLEAPYNSPETWKVIDEQTGAALEISTEVVKLLSDTEKKIIEFRID